MHTHKWVRLCGGCYHGQALWAVVGSHALNAAVLLHLIGLPENAVGALQAEQRQSAMSHALQHVPLINGATAGPSDQVPMQFSGFMFSLCC